VSLIPPGELEALCALGTRRSFRKGAEIFAEGDRSDHMGVLLKGRVKITCLDEDGRDTVLALREPGDLLGELSAIDKLPRSASAYALEPVEVVVIDAHAFTEYLRAHGAASFALLEMLTARLRESDLRRLEFGSQSCLARVAGRLLEMHERFGGTSLQLTQDELAGWVGCSREAAAKALATLRSMDVVRTARRRVEVLDVARLQEISRV